jgi:AcrR family transcriptional regulator
MAQPSKKDYIATSALPLFFEHGIKGTSVDMVVKTSKVSKPTVYNHFPDKGALFLHVVELWLNTQPKPTLTATSSLDVAEQIDLRWLTAETLNLYALIIGEGFRAPEAAQLFKQKFDAPWRACVLNWAEENGECSEALLEKVSHQLLTKLMA